MVTREHQSPLWQDGTELPVQVLGPVNTGSRARRTIQDVLFEEGLIAARLSPDAASLPDLQRLIVSALHQNSQETRVRYSQSILGWFFRDGVDGLAARVWSTYHDDHLEADVLRFLYLQAEPAMGVCVARGLFPLEEGMQVPSSYFERFLTEELQTTPPSKTAERVKSNLKRLGFLRRRRGAEDVVSRVVPTSTAVLVLVHHLFAADAPRTIELRNLLANPFWKFLGIKTEDHVRAILREAVAGGILSKYVAADELEQITTWMTLDELFARRVTL